MLSVTWLFLAPLLACSDGGEDSGSPPDITEGTQTETCGGISPVAESLVISNGGLRNFEGEDAPTVGLELILTDEDGDIHQGTMQIWYDELVDEAVDTDTDPYGDRIFSGIGDACFVDRATLNLAIRVGTEFDYNTVYEFAALFIDANGEVSNALVASGVTPNEDGSDGDPVD
jgi:hypothetical protein